MEHVAYDVDPMKQATRSVLQSGPIDLVKGLNLKLTRIISFLVVYFGSGNEVQFLKQVG